MSSSFTSSPSLARSSSTPYDLYRARRGTTLDSNDSYGRGSTSSTPKSAFLPGSTYSPSYVGSPLAQSTSRSSPLPEVGSPVRRKGVSFGSPGIRATGGSTPLRDGVPDPEGIRGPMRKKRVSKAFIRRKSFQQKLQDLPSTAADWLSSWSLTFSEVLQDEAMGYPLGLALHSMSLLSHLLSPESDLFVSLIAGVDSSARETHSVFAGSKTRTGGLREMRRAATQARKITFWSWTAGALSIFLVLLAIANAYALLTAKRKYRLWMRKPEERPQSQNAKLVPVHLDEDSKPSYHDVFVAWTLRQLHSIPILGWFVPDAPEFDKSHELDAQIHEIDVWEAPEVLLRIGVLYSPLHALLWHFAGTAVLPLSGVLPWLAFFLVLILLSLQGYVLSKTFAQLVKDQKVLAAEVMHEYDQKFVLPRAMPAVRDASTMTSETDVLGGDESDSLHHVNGRASFGSPVPHGRAIGGAAKQSSGPKSRDKASGASDESGGERVPGRKAGKAAGRMSRLRDGS